MSNPNEIESNLINSFVSASDKGIITWEKLHTRGPNCYFTKLKNNQEALLDKYYAFSGTQPKECFNFSILKNEVEVVIEVAECLEDSELYQKLKNLYKNVDTKFREREYESINPVLNEITKSLQN
jgi:hypothetical protein